MKKSVFKTLPRKAKIGIIAGISAVAGTSDISGLTTENIAVHSVYAASTANLAISDSVLGVTGTNNAKAENGGKLTLNNTVIEGTSKNHGIMVEKGGHFMGNGLTVRNTAGSAIRVKCSSEGNDVEIDGFEAAAFDVFERFECPRVVIPAGGLYAYFKHSCFPPFRNDCVQKVK